MLLRPSDERFLTQKAMPHFGIRDVAVSFSPSTARWPDIWVLLDPGQPPVITVTREWQRQSWRERRKRLVHELLHCVGLNHGRKGKLNYSTRPEHDTYSRRVYEKIATRRAK